jgi:thioester reductase-like protein
LYGGYCQSKWVAEKLVHLAQSRGLPIAVYWPGLIAGDSRTGVSNTEDVLSKMMRGWIEAGSVPQLDGGTDMTPVDYVSRAIVYLFSKSSSLGRIFHLFNSSPVHVGTIAGAMQSMGFPVESAVFHEWRAKMAALTISQKSSLSSLAPFFDEEAVAGFDENSLPPAMPAIDASFGALGILCTTRPARFDSSRTLEALKDSSIVCPVVDAGVLGLTLRTLLKRDY